LYISMQHTFDFICVGQICHFNAKKMYTVKSKSNFKFKNQKELTI
jgi:hypothetical protein